MKSMDCKTHDRRAPVTQNAFDVLPHMPHLWTPRFRGNLYAYYRRTIGGRKHVVPISNLQHERLLPGDEGFLEAYNRIHVSFGGEPISSDSKPTSFVYFIEAGDCVKIGKSTDVQSRITTLQTASQHTLKLVGLMAGGAREERRLHAAFSEYRTNGEWFSIKGRLGLFLSLLPQDMIASACLVNTALRKVANADDCINGLQAE